MVLYISGRSLRTIGDTSRDQWMIARVIVGGGNSVKVNVMDFTKLMRLATSEQSCSILAAICGGIEEGYCSQQKRKVWLLPRSYQPFEPASILSGGGQDHSNVGWEPLKEKFMDESFIWESTSSCCILRSNWVGLRSPSSLLLSNSCSRRCSEAAVCLTSCSLSTS